MFIKNKGGADMENIVWQFDTSVQEVEKAGDPLTIKNPGGGGGTRSSGERFGA